MSPVLRVCLLAGCAGLLLLDAPNAGALLAQGMAGPYREIPRAEPQTAVLSTRMAITPGSILFGEQEPWCEGLPGGL